ncbi:MAG: hypothetical protein ACHQJ5_09480 [Vicinamibacteria bacterium]|jgi:hypothetical protein
MRSRLLIPLALTAVLGAVAVAGCGGDDETASTSASGANGIDGPALTEAEFATQGNAICAAGNKELDAAANEVFTGQKPTDAQLQQYADIAVPSIQGQIDAVRALPAPESIADQVGTFLDDAQSALDEVEADPSLLAASDADDPFADVNQQADDLGLTECGS